MSRVPETLYDDAKSNYVGQMGPGLSKFFKK